MRSRRRRRPAKRLVRAHSFKSDQTDSPSSIRARNTPASTATDTGRGAARGARSSSASARRRRPRWRCRHAPACSARPARPPPDGARLPPARRRQVGGRGDEEAVRRARQARVSRRLPCLVNAAGSRPLASGAQPARLTEHEQRQHREAQQRGGGPEDADAAQTLRDAAARGCARSGVDIASTQLNGLRIGVSRAGPRRPLQRLARLRAPLPGSGRSAAVESPRRRERRLHPLAVLVWWQRLHVERDVARRSIGQADRSSRLRETPSLDGRPAVTVGAAA
jgi:hypothetical protein